MQLLLKMKLLVPFLTKVAFLSKVAFLTKVAFLKSIIFSRSIIFIKSCIFSKSTIFNFGYTRVEQCENMKGKHVQTWKYDASKTWLSSLNVTFFESKTYAIHFEAHTIFLEHLWQPWYQIEQNIHALWDSLSLPKNEIHAFLNVFQFFDEVKRNKKVFSPLRKQTSIWNWIQFLNFKFHAVFELFKNWDQK